jgi:hypothetical protein
MTVLKNTVFKCYFKVLRNMPRELKNTKYHKNLSYTNRRYCRCKYCINIFNVKENYYLEKFKITPI